MIQETTRLKSPTSKTLVTIKVCYIIKNDEIIKFIGHSKKGNKQDMRYFVVEHIIESRILLCKRIDYHTAMTHVVITNQALQNNLTQLSLKICTTLIAAMTRGTCELLMSRLDVHHICLVPFSSGHSESTLCA